MKLIRELKTKRVQKNINDLSKEINQLAKTYKNEWELQMAGSVTSEAKMHKFIDKIVKMVYDEGFDKGYAEAREIYDTSEFD